LPAINEAFIPEMFERVNKRLRAIEEQLALLSEKAGVPYTRPGEGVPSEVVALARAGQTMDAIKKYRELTGAGFQEANDIVTGL
jgi:ribosomal protein L7/L12